jgi:arginase
MDFEDKLTAMAPGSVAVLGIPLDENSSFLCGAAKAPQSIRKILHQRSGNLCAEDERDLGKAGGWSDLGDLTLSGGETSFTEITDAVDAILNQDGRVISLGGDHSITYPVIRAYARKYSDLNILHLDAHPDLFDELDGNRRSHGSPFARIMEAKLASRLLQLGIRTTDPHQREQANRFGVEIVNMKDWQPGFPIDIEDPYYLSIDLDCLDPAFAPGISHHEPGGFSTRDVLGIIQGLPTAPVGADIVELNPDRDPLETTAAVAVKFLKETLARMIS